jgi:hypothetical protein
MYVVNEPFVEIIHESAQRLLVKPLTQDGIAHDVEE